MRVESPQVDSQMRTSVVKAMPWRSAFTSSAGRTQLCLGMMEMRQFLFADRQDDGVELRVALRQEMQLVVQMAVHRGLDGGGAGPDTLPSEQCGRKAKQPAPKLHSRITRHGRELRFGIAAWKAAQCSRSWPSISVSAGRQSGQSQRATRIWAE